MVSQTGGDRCGPASAEMVARYFKLELSPQAVAAMNVQSDQGGVTGALLKRAFQQSSFAAEVFPGALDHGGSGLYRYLDKGWPVIVRLGEPDEVPHYVVVVGYDPADGGLALLDPAKGPWAMSAVEFKKAWEPARFALLAVPRS